MSDSSYTTSVPAPYLGDEEFVAPAESAILKGRLADINAAFGGGLNVTTLSTPQGQLAMSETAIIGAVNAQFLALANGVDPARASGRMQDAIARIYFIERKPAKPTVAQVTCTGLPGTTIPAGAVIKAQDEYQYTSTEAGTIPASGSIVLPFACTIAGAIPCPAQPFTIFRPVSGWDTAISKEAGTLGAAVESRADFEARRAASVAQNALGSTAAIRGAVLNVDGVLDAYVVDNPSGEPATIGGVQIAPHSVYCSVVGGDAEAVARAIWSKKSMGCDYNGNTAVVVEDTSYTDAPPRYTVRYQVPELVPVRFAVTLAPTSNLPSNALPLVKAAILKAFSGADGGQRARIGVPIYASRYYAGIASLGSWVQIVSIQVGTSVDGMGNAVSLPISQAPTTSEAYISLSLAAS